MPIVFNRIYCEQNGIMVDNGSKTYQNVFLLFISFVGNSFIQIYYSKYYNRSPNQTKNCYRDNLGHFKLSS